MGVFEDSSHFHNTYEVDVLCPQLFKELLDGELPELPCIMHFREVHFAESP